MRRLHHVWASDKHACQRFVVQRTEHAVGHQHDFVPAVQRNWLGGEIHRRVIRQPQIARQRAATRILRHLPPRNQPQSRLMVQRRGIVVLAVERQQRTIPQEGNAAVPDGEEVELAVADVRQHQR